MKTIVILIMLSVPGVAVAEDYSNKVKNDIRNLLSNVKLLREACHKKVNNSPGYQEDINNAERQIDKLAIYAVSKKRKELLREYIGYIKTTKQYDLEEANCIVNAMEASLEAAKLTN